MVSSSEEVLRGRLASLQADINRLRNANKLMQMANSALRANNIQKLLQLGFSQERINSLVQRYARDGAGFPRSALRNNLGAIRLMSRKIDELRKVLQP